MRSQSFPWILVLALVVLLAMVVFLFLMADPGARMPAPSSSDATDVFKPVTTP